MKYLSNKDFTDFYISLPGLKPWYLMYFGIMPRGFTYENELYINSEAYYFDSKDYNLLVKHEQGHLKGLNHTWFGIMASTGLIRYLTTF